MPFGLWTLVGPRKHPLHGRAHWHHLANTIHPSMFGWAEWRGGDAGVCQITLTTCYY